MVHTDHNRNTTCISCAEYKISCPKFKSIPWDDCLPVPPFLIPWSSWIIFLVAILCFGNSMTGDFVFDDSEAIINNLDLKTETPILSIFQNDFWGTKLTHNASHKSYRPLTVLTFRLNYLVSGFHPFSYHIVNIVLHGIVSTLLLKVMTLVLNIVLEDEAPKAAFLSALLFAVHPIHTESVSAVVGRADLLCGLFFLLSFLSYVDGASDMTSASNLSVWKIVRSVLLAGVAMLCKEHGITAIGICCFCDLVFYKLDKHIFYIFLTLKSPAPNDASLLKHIRQFVVKQSILVLGGCLLFSLRWYIMGASTPIFQQVDNPASFEDSIFVRMINYNYIYALNVWLLIHPFWLCFDWSMGCVPLIYSANDPRLLIVVLFWICFGCLLYSVITYNNSKIRRLLCLSLMFMLVPFLPASNLFFRVGFVIAERILYLPSMGFCLLVVIGMRHISSLLGQNNYWVLQCCVFLLITIFGVRCIQRSSDWMNEENLFRSGLKVCPLNAKIHYNIAKNAADHGNREVAIQEYREAIRLNPFYDQAMNNLANILKDQGKLLEAEKLLISAIKIRPDFAAAWMNLGIVQTSLKKANEAEKSYLMALHFRKRYPDCFYNLGNLYLEQKHYDEAYKSWRNATAIMPTHLVAWNNMVIMLDSLGDLEKAERVAREALVHLPSEASLHFNLANILGKGGKYAESEKHFLKAIQLNDQNPTYHTNLGVLYHRWKKYHLAEAAYKYALKLNSNIKSAHDNLHLLYKTLKRV